MIVPMGKGLLHIRGDHSSLLVGKALHRFVLFIETCSDEYCQTVEPGDLIVVSLPEDTGTDAARMLLELVREHHIPLIVLPKTHPASKRLKMVVSVAPEIILACDIGRGTHPEQHLICSSEELSGMHLRTLPDELEIESAPPHLLLTHLPE